MIFGYFTAVIFAFGVLFTGLEAEAKSTQLQTKLKFSVVTAEGCGKVDVGKVKNYRGAQSAKSSCVINGGDWDIGIMLSEATAPINSVPIFKSKSLNEIKTMPDTELQKLLSKWVKSNLQEPQGAKGWSMAPAKVQSISKGSLSRGPYVCARYTQISKHSQYQLKADAIGTRCARLSKDKAAIEEVAVQTTAFFSLGQVEPKDFGQVAERTIKSLRYRR